MNENTQNTVNMNISNMNNSASENQNTTTNSVNAQRPLNRWKNTTKTQAKRMGVKSVLSYGDGSLAVTTFGKGNKAEVVLNAPNGGRDVATPLQNEPFTIDYINDSIGFERGELESILENPAQIEQEARKDYLGLKSVLEKEFFGKEFPNDTVRIQIIYNILDIMKIFGVYVNDIIYAVNNLQPEPTDVIGLSLSNKNLKEALKNMSPFFGFYGDAFKIPAKASKPEITQKNQEEADTYNGQVLRVLGELRQASAHFKDADKFFSSCEKIEKDLKQIESNNKKNKVNCWQVIEDAYNKRVKDINENFLQHSRTNLGIIFDMLGAYYDEEKAEITQQYYQFSILKQGKNMGLSLTKLREMIIDTYCSYIKGTDYDSFRQKLYVVTDFLLYRTLKDSETLDNMVAQLRLTSDEDEKEELYHQFAETVWAIVGNKLTSFFDLFNEGYPTFSTEKIPEYWLGKVAMGRETRLPFVMMLSFLCNFLEGKEINELLTAYIHKFENIQAFIDTQMLLKDKIEFSDKYKSFNKFGCRFAGDVAKQLRTIVSIGKMKPDLDGAKRLLYVAAIKTLGVPDDSEYITDKWLEENLLLSAEQKRDKEKKLSVNPFRNFIANNVIESRRFLYLVRYTKPESVRAIMTNAKIVHYALSRLPEPQIKMYYQRTFGAVEDATLDKQLNTLTNILTGLSFDTLLKNRAGIITDTTNRPVAIERLKAQIGLYLTTAYLVVKNLVKTNARYYIAFSALERDMAMLDAKDKDMFEINFTPFTFVNSKGETVKDENPYYALTEYYLDRDDEVKYVPEPGKPFDRDACHQYWATHKTHFTRKWRDIFRKEVAEAKQVSTTGYLGIFVRNTAEHMNVLNNLSKYIDSFRSGSNGPMKSYFELYHYIVQRLALDSHLAEKFDESQRLNLDPYREFIESTGLPHGDLIHIAYCTLGYNLPRYKNLTIEALFDADSADGQERAKRLAEARK